MTSLNEKCLRVPYLCKCVMAIIDNNPSESPPWD